MWALGVVALLEGDVDGHSLPQVLSLPPGRHPKGPQFLPRCWSPNPAPWAVSGPSVTMGVTTLLFLALI